MEFTKELSYEDKKKIYTNLFSIGNFLECRSLNDRLILISLISLVYLKNKEKNDKITVLEILLKITNQKVDNSGFYNMLEGLSILVEDWCYEIKEADSCGLKTSQDIINKIKEILNSWIPF